MEAEILSMSHILTNTWYDITCHRCPLCGLECTWLNWFVISFHCHKCFYATYVIKWTYTQPNVVDSGEIQFYDILIKLFCLSHNIKLSQKFCKSIESIFLTLTIQMHTSYSSLQFVWKTMVTMDMLLTIATQHK